MLAECPLEQIGQAFVLGGVDVVGHTGRVILEPDTVHALFSCRPALSPAPAGADTGQFLRGGLVGLTGDKTRVSRGQAKGRTMGLTLGFNMNTPSDSRTNFHESKPTPRMMKET
jgi:hypothetical protein